MWNQIRLPLREQSDLGLNCVSNRLLKHFSRRQKQMIIVIGGSVVVDSLLIVTPIVGFCNCSMFCCVLLYVHSSFAIISIGK